MTPVWMVTWTSAKTLAFLQLTQHDFSIFFKKLESHKVLLQSANANNWIFKFFQEGLFTKAPISHQCGLEWFTALNHSYSRFLIINNF